MDSTTSSVCTAEDGYRGHTRGLEDRQRLKSIKWFIYPQIVCLRAWNGLNFFFFLSIHIYLYTIGLTCNLYSWTYCIIYVFTASHAYTLVCNIFIRSCAGLWVCMLSRRQRSVLCRSNKNNTYNRTFLHPRKTPYSRVENVG